jgi:hypothetical protein
MPDIGGFPTLIPPLGRNFRAFLTTPFAIAAATYTKLPFDTALFDPAGYVNLSNGPNQGQINLPAGTWLIKARMLCTGSVSSANQQVSIYKNGIQISEGTFSPTDSSGFTGKQCVNDIVQVSGSDYLAIYGLSSIATTVFGPQSTTQTSVNTFVSGVQIG